MEDLQLPPVYRFPYSDYTIVGEKSEIDRMCKVEDKKIYIDHQIIEDAMSKECPNYVATGYGSETGRRVMAAFHSALSSLPISESEFTDMVLYMWSSREFVINCHELKEMEDYISANLAHISVIWGIGIDESLGEKIKVSMLTTSK